MIFSWGLQNSAVASTKKIYQLDVRLLNRVQVKQAGESRFYNYIFQKEKESLFLQVI